MNEMSRLIGKEYITYQPNQFNVVFPLLMNSDDAQFLKDKYTLMPLPNNHICVTTFANVDENLIKEFITDYQKFYLKDHEKNFLRAKL